MITGMHWKYRCITDQVGDVFRRESKLSDTHKKRSHVPKTEVVSGLLVTTGTYMVPTKDSKFVHDTKN